MGLSITDMREQAEEGIWKLRCKVFPPQEDKPRGFEEPPKTVSLSSSDAAGEKPVTVETTVTSTANRQKRGLFGKSKQPASAPGKVADGKDPTFGQDLSVKTFYEGKNSHEEHYDWVNHPPKQISKSAARAQDRVAIKVYKIKDRDRMSMKGRYPLRYHMIEIQNPSIISVLEPIVKKKENMNLDVNELATFNYPFRELWFCWEEISDAYKKAVEAQEAEGMKLGLLLEVMNNAFAELKVKWKHMKSSGLVDFKTVWTLFPRGSTVYSYGMNSETVCKVESTSILKKMGMSFMIIKAKSVSFNGEEFVWEEKSLVIPEFKGNMPINELAHYPLEHHPEGEKLSKRLIARGKKALDLQGLKYCCYDGIALHHPDEKTIEKHNVESRILVDVVGYNKYHLSKGKRESKDPVTGRNRAIQRAGKRRQNMSSHQYAFDDDTGLYHPNDTGAGDSNIDGVELPDQNSDSKTKNVRLTEEQQQRNKEEMLENEEDLAFMSDTICGYALKNKLWVDFYIEDIKPMAWNDQAYDHLVYDHQQKDLVLSFVEHHKRQTNPTSTIGAKSKVKGKSVSAPGTVEDVILGKGQGLILLLSGPPGTGKTLTAEAVADRAHRPLFYLQAEDLGINAAALGANVKKVFEMATDWDAVILLDEADVFMAERNPNDIHRNELVSIFLRELEYFRGIIFLTTNLYHTIDAAFRSRVSLHLLFRALDKNARESVWTKFLDRMTPHDQSLRQIKEVDEDGNDISTEEEDEAKSRELMKKPLDEEDIKELALWTLNGREIKNAVKMVRSWCDQKGYTMTLERMESGIKVTSPHASKEGEGNEDLYDE